MGIKKAVGDKKSLIYYSIILFFILTLIYLSVAVILQRNTNEIRKEEIVKSEKRLVDIESEFFSDRIDSLISDLLHMKDNLINEGLNKGNFDFVANEWRIFADRKGIYDQLRYIDQDGMETIRVNYAKDGSEIVPATRLQNKHGRYYFQDTIGLRENVIYISKLDLNVERGKIEEPIKPMLRLSTPVYDYEGNLRGIVIANYYASDLLDYFAKISSTSLGDIYLLNSEGYWIFDSSNGENEWAFMYKDKQDKKLENYKPDVWKYVSQGTEGTYINGEGFYTFKKVIDQTDSFRESEDMGFEILLGDGNWTIVSIIDEESELSGIFQTSIFKNFCDKIVEKRLVLLGLLLISASFGVVMTLNKLSQEQIKYFSEYDEMTGTLNRRAGLEVLSSKYRQAIKDGGYGSICFLDINGLKEVNDYLGHEAGDELIMTAVDRIQHCVRKSDYIVRLGGDEFLIIFNEIDSKQAEEIWERIKHEYQIINDTENRDYIISVSHGIEEFSFDFHGGIDEIINIADQKMYDEKRIIKSKINVVRRKKD